MTGWANTDARQVDCSTCGATRDSYCRTPLGRKTNGGEPHGDRLALLFQTYGHAPWRYTPPKEATP
jgi:hypothetical protein